MDELIQIINQGEPGALDFRSKVSFICRNVGILLKRSDYEHSFNILIGSIISMEQNLVDSSISNLLEQFRMDTASNSSTKQTMSP